MAIDPGEKKYTEPQLNSQSKIFSSQKGQKNKASIEDHKGKIADTIGTGKNAKDSIIYLTIKWAFFAAIVITIFVIINYWFFRENEKVPDFTGDLKIIWEIVIPIITLALGYAFGKQE